MNSFGDKHDYRPDEIQYNTRAFPAKLSAEMPDDVHVAEYLIHNFRSQEELKQQLYRTDKCFVILLDQNTKQLILDSGAIYRMNNTLGTILQSVANMT